MGGSRNRALGVLSRLTGVARGRDRELCPSRLLFWLQRMDVRSRTVIGTPPSTVDEARAALNSVVMTWTHDMATGQPVYIGTPAGRNCGQLGRPRCPAHTTDRRPGAARAATFPTISVPHALLGRVANAVIWFWEDHNYIYTNSCHGPPRQSVAATRTAGGG